MKMFVKSVHIFSGHKYLINSEVNLNKEIRFIFPNYGYGGASFIPKGKRRRIFVLGVKFEEVDYL